LKGEEQNKGGYSYLEELYIKFDKHHIPQQFEKQEQEHSSMQKKINNKKALLSFFFSQPRQEQTWKLY